MSTFQFKQFNIIQEKSAMKVGTDGVLLGAWSDVANAQNVLDIGAGTGLISLMVAQRNQNSEITAIEIDENAYLECEKNFAASPWSEKLKIINTDLKLFPKEKPFDLIISNPPFFNNTFKAETEERNKARQTESLSFEDLLFCTASLLSKNGKAYFIIPFLEEENFIALAEQQKMYLNKKTRVKGNINTAVKRSLLEFSFKEKKVIESELVIEISRHVYTTDYIALTKDFYLKM